MKNYYAGWEIHPEDREWLLGLFSPSYRDIIAHHVTYKFGVDQDFIMPKDGEGIVVGVADDGEKVQALVVEIGGTTQRPDGKVYHITWSIDRSLGARPVHSNSVIAEFGYTDVPRTLVRLKPSLFPL